MRERSNGTALAINTHDLQATKENLDMLEDDQNLLFPSN